MDSINTLNTYKTTHKESASKKIKKKNDKGNENKNEYTQESSNNIEMKYTFSTIEGRCYIYGTPGH